MICESSLRPTDGPLYPEERALLEGCVEKRQREIAAGRRCARRALAQLGITSFPLLPGPDRAPIWPAGIVGSITHTDGPSDGYCAVAVAQAGQFGGLGIDAEPRLRLPEDLWTLVLDAGEKREALRDSDPGTFARLIFSAKETTYKAVFPTLKRILEFADVHVDVDLDAGLFLARLVGAQTVPPVGNPLVGRLVIDNELIVTAMVLSCEGSGPTQEGLSPRDVPC